MATTETRRILEIGTADFTDLNNKQFGYMTGNDTDLGYPMWGGKDGSGNITRWLAKDKDAKVNDLYLTNADHGGTQLARLIHSGDTDTYLEFQGDYALLEVGGVDAIKITEAATDLIEFGMDVSFGGNDMQSGAGNDFVLQLGDNAGSNKLSVQDSDDVEIFKLDSDGNLYVSQYIYHLGDTPDGDNDPTEPDTYIEFQENYMRFFAGNSEFIRIVEDAAVSPSGSFVEFNPADSPTNHTSFIFNTSVEDHLILDADLQQSIFNTDLLLAGGTQDYLITDNGNCLVIQGDSDLGTDWLGNNDTVAIMSDDAFIALVSSDDGTYGSAIALKQVDGTTYENSWGIVRQTNGDGDGDGSLQFTYGTNVNVYSNAARLSILPSGNVGIGIVPDDWDSTFLALQTVHDTVLCGSDQYTYVGQNFYYDDTDNRFEFIDTGVASQIRFDKSGQIDFFMSSASGSADGAITFKNIINISTTAINLNPAGSTSAMDVVAQTDNFSQALFVDSSADKVSITAYDVTLSASHDMIISEGAGGGNRAVWVDNNGKIFFS